MDGFSFVRHGGLFGILPGAIIAAPFLAEGAINPMGDIRRAISPESVGQYFGEDAKKTAEGVSQWVQTAPVVRGFNDAACALANADDWASKNVGNAFWAPSKTITAASQKSEKAFLKAVDAGWKELWA